MDGCRLVGTTCTSTVDCQQIVDLGRCQRTGGCEWLGDQSQGLCETEVVPCERLSAGDCELSGCELDGRTCRNKDSQEPLATGLQPGSSAS
jgi:hypothetical protein